jgi:hypothetical protein
VGDEVEVQMITFLTCFLVVPLLALNLWAIRWGGSHLRVIIEMVRVEAKKPGFDAKVRVCREREGKVAAIKLVREVKGLMLKEAKEYVERICPDLEFRA